MSSTTALTGRLGKFKIGGTEVARTKQWSVDQSLAHTSEWGDSDSGGYTNRAAGRKDGKFSSEGVFDTDNEQYDVFGFELFHPDDTVAATLFLNDSLYWNFPIALCLSFKLTVNIDTEEVIGWNSEFGADGIYYRPGAS